MALALLLWAPAVAAAHPGHGPTDVVVGDRAFSPETKFVVPGDRVFWFWLRDDRNHSITSDPGQAESFDSDPGELPALVNHSRNESFSYRFSRQGRFSYHCKVHPSMRGTIVVAVPDIFFSTAPQITRASIRPRRVCSRRTRRCRRLRAVLRFTISEVASVAGRIERRARGRWRRRRSFDFQAGRGANRKRLPTRGLKPGRYRVVLQAYGQQRNASAAVRVRFRIRT